MGGLVELSELAGRLDTPTFSYGMVPIFLLLWLSSFLQSFELLDSQCGK